MNEQLHLNVALLKRSVPNLTSAARAVGLRPATVSNLCTGKIPVGRAEVKTLVALANLANCTLDDLIIRGNAVKMIETGIKVLDVFAPLVQGGTIGFVARAQMGQQVLVAELFYRLKEQGFTSIFYQTTENHEVVTDIRESVDFVGNSMDDVVTFISKVEDKDKILLASERSAIESGDIYETKDRLQTIGVTSITTMLFDPSGEAVDEEDPFGPLDTLWSFDMDLVARRIYPGVNPISSTSILLEDALLDTNHLTIQRRARKFLRRYREIRFLVNAIGLDKIHEADVHHFNRGARLEAFLSQAFYIAEPVTGKPGEYVSLHDSLHSIQAILDGAADSIEVDQLLYIGKL
ncbi:helix-turn-helix domain-containing protein [Bacillus salitolerans]|uniref:Helix-turn-helix domain-containing protein n=1 Tax=Bacillus salitolerans TaxID=1437434 RepID=A0ABW4LSI8_9BACI